MALGNENGSLVENLDDWRLHLADWRWERLTERKWQQYTELAGEDQAQSHGISCCSPYLIEDDEQDEEVCENKWGNWQKSMESSPILISLPNSIVRAFHMRRCPKWKMNMVSSESKWMESLSDM